MITLFHLTPPVAQHHHTSQIRATEPEAKALRDAPLHRALLTVPYTTSGTAAVLALREARGSKPAKYRPFGTSWRATKMVVQGANTDVLSRRADLHAMLRIAGLLPRRPHLPN
jgi:hypothetical protein